MYKKHIDLSTNLNFVKIEHYRSSECIWTPHKQNVGRFVGPQVAQDWVGNAHAPWVILSISSNAMMTPPTWFIERLCRDMHDTNLI